MWLKNVAILPTATDEETRSYRWLFASNL